jgi:serine/threonine-protein kinase
MPFEARPGLVVAGKYRLDRLLGEGGMGAVWAATHTTTRKRLALKLLKAPEERRAELGRRFRREARAACAARHPNIVEVHDVLELEDGTPAMIMELLEGETLQRRLDRVGRLDVAETTGVLLPVLSAIGAAHDAGIVHRDLKPENIYLARALDGAVCVKVLDFGVAKVLLGSDGGVSGALTGTGAMLGTPFYMSPEQALDEKDIDLRSDLWAMGVILYRCLSGVLPTRGASLGHILRTIMVGPLQPLAEVAPTLPREVLEVTDRLLARDRALRPANAAEVAAVLTPFAGARLELPEADAPGAPEGAATVESAPSPDALAAATPPDLAQTTASTRATTGPVRDGRGPKPRSRVFPLAVGALAIAVLSAAAGARVGGGGAAATQPPTREPTAAPTPPAPLAVAPPEPTANPAAPSSSALAPIVTPASSASPARPPRRPAPSPHRR